MAEQQAALAPDLHTPAPGSMSLTHLLSTLTTILHPSTFVYLSLAPGTLPPPTLFVQLQFAEAEGLTIISTRESAELHKMRYTFPCRMITLNVHSSLEASGFMATIAARIRDNEKTKDVGVNPVGAFFHDHLFVPLGREQEVLEVIWELAREAREERERIEHGHDTKLVS